MSVTSKLSPFEIRQNTETGVQCATLEYQSDYLSTERRCVSCMKCTTEQPEQDVGLRARWPGMAAVRQRIPLVDEALLVIILWAVFPVDHVLGDLIEEVGPLAAVGEPWPAVIAYFGSITAALIAYGGASAVSSWWSGLEWETTFTRFAYAYLPFSIMYMLGNHVILGLMEDGGTTLNAFFNGLGIPVTFSEALASGGTIATWEWINETIWPAVGVIWGIAIIWYSAKTITRTDQQALQAILPHVLVLVISTVWIMAAHGH